MFYYTIYKCISQVTAAIFFGFWNTLLDLDTFEGMLRHVLSTLFEGAFHRFQSFPKSPADDRLHITIKYKKLLFLIIESGVYFPQRFLKAP